MESKFEQALNLDTKPLLRMKGNSPFLPWASALAEFLKIHPRGTVKFFTNEYGNYTFEERIGVETRTVDGKDGEESKEVVTNAGTVIGYYVKVAVCDGEEEPLTHELTLPIMSMSNKANMNFTIMEVNKAQLRCMTKVIAMFGIGLTNYAGEEYYQYEIGAEFDAIKAEILEIAKEITTLDEARRVDVVKVIGNKGHIDKTKDIEEANEKKAKMNELLQEVKKAQAKATPKNTEKKEGEK